MALKEKAGPESFGQHTRPEAVAPHSTPSLHYPAAEGDDIKGAPNTPRPGAGILMWERNTNTQNWEAAILQFSIGSKEEVFDRSGIFYCQLFPYSYP